MYTTCLHHMHPQLRSPTPPDTPNMSAPTFMFFSRFFFFYNPLSPISTSAGTWVGASHWSMGDLSATIATFCSLVLSITKSVHNVTYSCLSKQHRGSPHIAALSSRSQILELRSLTKLSEVPQYQIVQQAYKGLRLVSYAVRTSRGGAHLFTLN